MASCSVHAIWIFHHDTDCFEHIITNDESKCCRRVVKHVLLVLIIIVYL